MLSTAGPQKSLKNRHQGREGFEWWAVFTWADWTGLSILEFKNLRSRRSMTGGHLLLECSQISESGWQVQEHSFLDITHSVKFLLPDAPLEISKKNLPLAFDQISNGSMFQMLICWEFTDQCPKWWDTEFLKLAFIFIPLGESSSHKTLFSSPQDEGGWDEGMVSPDAKRCHKILLSPSLFYLVRNTRIHRSEASLPMGFVKGDLGLMKKKSPPWRGEVRAVTLCTHLAKAAGACWGRIKTRLEN